jgi:MFS family permease
MATITLSTIWFPPEQRTVCISAQSIAFVVGGILGFALGPFFVGDDATVAEVKTFLKY